MLRAPRCGCEVAVPVVATCVLLVTVFVSLHHAEIVAVRVGEPYGTLLLTIAVTTIEVSIILSVMLHAENNPSLAREIGVLDRDDRLRRASSGFA